MALYLGIDPDNKKSGVALWNTVSRRYEFLKLMTFVELIEYLKIQHKYLYKVHLEAGWLNKSNWHLDEKDTLYSAAKKGHDVGLNHQVGILIEEFLRHYEVKYRLIKPTTQKWTEKEFIQITKIKIQRGQGRSQLQELIDSARLVFGE